MFRRVLWTARAALWLPIQLVLLFLVTPVSAQPVVIPLQYINVNGWSLGINIGINGGAPQPYLFDTGSAVFNAAYNPATWGAPFDTPTVPHSTVPNGTAVKYCYGSPPCYVGNLIQVPNLSFYAAGATGSSAPAVTLSATQGYQINAIYEATNNDGTKVFQSYPEHFRNGDRPILYDTFFGIFGAGNFTSYEPNSSSTPVLVGGVLGQAIIPGVLHQGYVVSANGQANPATTTNSPSSGTLEVKIGGNKQSVSPCVACVTVGLTPQLIGQFALVSAVNQAGVVPWAATGTNFPNPNGSGTGNNASQEFGANFTTILSGGGGSTVSNTNPSLLDTGTPDFALASNMANGSTVAGTGFSISGASLSNGTIAGLPTSSSILQGPGYTYGVHFKAGTDNTSTLGIGFFMQNSVMFDLTGQTIGYSPFYVTNADLSTADGTMVVDDKNLWLGLAGVISGPGGVTLKTGGVVQLSATNTYAGLTKIDDGGALYIAGIGSIASSSGVENDGIFDISRAWASVSIRALSGKGTVTLGGQNLIIANASGSFEGTIADGGVYPVAGGSLTIAGGSQTLGGVNTYTGLTTVAAGATLLLGPTASIASSSGLANHGTFDMSQATQPVFLQNIYGAGQMNLGSQKLTASSASGLYSGVIADGGSAGGTGASLALTGGTLVLTGSNTYSGGTSVSGGATLGILSDSSLGNAAGGLTLNNGTLAAVGTITSARAVTLGAGGGTLNTNGNAVSFSNALSGPGGLLKTGLNVLTLGGANTYSGGTTVAQGTLALTGSMTGSLSILSGATFTSTGGWSLAPGAVFNNAGTFQSLGGAPLVNQGTLIDNGTLTSSLVNSGTLGGNGTIIGTVTNNGIVSPGNSIGTLNVVGNFTQSAGSFYQVETNSAGQADLVSVTGAPGTATLNGGTVVLTAATGVYAPSTTYTIVTTTGGVTGTYAGVSSLYPFLRPSLSYDANNVYLTLKPGGFGAGAATSNQAAVGRALDQSVAGSSGDFATVIGTMATYSLTMGQAAMNALSGQNYAGFGTANLGGGLLFMNAMSQQMSAARGTGNRESRTALALACDFACDGEGPSPWSIWGSAMGGTGTIAGNANAATLTYNAGGFATGVDYRFDPRFLAGIGVGFSSGSQWASGFSGQGMTNSYQVSLYGSFMPTAAFYVDALAGYGYNDNQMTRQIVLPNLAPRLAQGRTGANQFLGQVEAGYRIGIHEPAAASITPFARFQGTTVSQAGFTESGANSLNLNVAPQNTGSARSVLGAEFAGAFGPEGHEKLALQLRLGWAHEYASTSRPVTASFAGAPGTNFTTFGAAPPTDSAIFSLAANTAIAPGTALYLRYDGEMASGTSSHALNGGFRITW